MRIQNYKLFLIHIAATEMQKAGSFFSHKWFYSTVKQNIGCHQYNSNSSTIFACHLCYAAYYPDIRFAYGYFGFLSQHFICPEFEAGFISMWAIAWLVSVGAAALASLHLEIKLINFILENIILCLVPEKLLVDL